MSAAAAMLADGRFPSGGHAHSGGYEAASTAFELRSVDDLWHFLVGRLNTVGLVEASLVAAVMHRLDQGQVDWVELDGETEARIVSPVLRNVSRSLGRQWLRAGRRIWDSDALHHLETVFPEGPHQVLAYGAVAISAGLGLEEGVTVHLHHLVATSAGAAIRLHGLDPFDVQQCQTSMLASIDRLTREAVATSAGPLSLLPASGAPGADHMAEDHARWEYRLFRS